MLEKLAVLAFFTYILSSAFAEVFSLQASVTVNPPPIGLDVNVTVLTKEVEQGKNLQFLVELSKKALDEITVELKYEVIKRKGGSEEIIASKTDSMQLVDYNSMQKAILIPASLKAGRYELKVTATYFNQSDVDSDEFFVKKVKPMGQTSLLQAIFFIFGWFI